MIEIKNYLIPGLEVDYNKAMLELGEAYVRFTEVNTDESEWNKLQIKLQIAKVAKQKLNEAKE